MSAKRSFDVARSKQRTPKVIRRRTIRDRRPLKVRKEEALKRSVVISTRFVVFVIGGIIYLLWRPEIRINEVEAAGVVDPSSLVATAHTTLSGTYMGVLPRNSFFFYPERTIVERILEKHPEIVTVEVSRNGFSSLSLVAHPRQKSFLWCGVPEAPQETCYEADSDGFVFKPHQAEIGTSTLRVYAALEGGDEGMFPLKAKVAGVEKMGSILEFVTIVESFGVPIETIAIRDDEADLFAPHNTRITYVIGTEARTTESVNAAFPNLNLMDGSLLYVDLRFPGKVYLKKVGE